MCKYIRVQEYIYKNNDRQYLASLVKVWLVFVSVLI